MPAYVFGKSIDFQFCPIVDGVPVAVYSLVSARIYAATPSDEQIADAGAATTGHVGSRITSWADESQFTKVITFPALVDPNPHSSNEFEPYYIAVNFRYESGGPEVYLTEVVHVYRPDALTSRVSVNYTDLLKVERNLGDYFQPQDLEDFITLAKDEVFLRFAGLNKPVKRLFRLEKLNTCVKYKAVALACFDRYNDNAQAWLKKSQYFDARYDETFRSTDVGFDIEGDDAPAPDERAQNRTIYIQR